MRFLLKKLYSLIAKNNRGFKEVFTGSGAGRGFLCFFLILSVFSGFFVYSQDIADGSGPEGYIVDYYGVISNDLDLNMSTMISDLYFTQLSEIPNFTVFDKRIFPKNAEPSYTDLVGTQNSIFYTKIDKNQDEETWYLNYIVVNGKKQQQFSKKKKYDSFWKILMESKNELEVSIKDLIARGNMESGEVIAGGINAGTPVVFDDFTGGNGESSGVPGSYGYDNGSFIDGSGTVLGNGPSNGVCSEAGNSGKKLNIKSLEVLSGTWKGEESVDKIVILRGGRGFIIFNNGASMNISISIEESEQGQIISVKQKGNSNASFYPELPRKIALAAAVSAPPMEWSMTLLDNMTMEGTKTTLVQDKESFKVSKVPVAWEKIN